MDKLHNFYIIKFNIPRNLKKLSYVKIKLKLLY